MSDTTRLYCNACERLISRLRVFSLSSPTCPDCDAALELIELPFACGAALTGMPTFMAAIPVVREGDTAVASPSYSAGFFTRRQAS